MDHWRLQVNQLKIKKTILKTVDSSAEIPAGVETKPGRIEGNPNLGDSAISSLMPLLEPEKLF